MHADVIAKDILRHGFLYARGKGITEFGFQLGKKAFCGPALAQEEMLHARSVAAFAQPLLFAEDCRDSADYVDCLVLANEGVKLHCQMWICG